MGPRFRGDDIGCDATVCAVQSLITHSCHYRAYRLKDGVASLAYVPVIPMN